MIRPRRDPFHTGSDRFLLFLAGVSVTAAFLLAFALKPRLLTDLDHKLYDTFLTSAALPVTTERLLVVDIDETSLKRYGQWPWPRYRIAQLSEALFRAGVTVVGFDMVFAEPDRTSLSRLAEEMGRDLKVPVRFPEVPEAFFDNDRILADALKMGHSVLGFGVAFDPTSPRPPCQGKAPTISVLFGTNASENLSFLFQASSAVCNIPVLAQAASAQGFFNIRPDSDGILRRAPLIVEHNGSIYPCLALAILSATGKIKTVFVRVDSVGVDSLVMDGLTVPLDEQGNLQVRFRGPSRRVPYVSASDILDGATPAESLRNRIVLVGSTAAGLKDSHATPYDSVFPGVEVHAHILDNILTGDFIRRPRWMTGLEALLLAVSGFTAAAVFVYIGPLFGVGFSVTGSLALGIGAAWCLVSKGIYLSPLYPILTLLSNFALLSSMKYYREEKKVRAKILELSLVQEVTIETVANVAETRDPETGGHIKRTQHYVRALAEHLRRMPKYKKVLTDDTVELLFRSAPLHDLGKVGVPDNILLKPSRLTEEEFERMKLHTTYAYNIISAAEHRLGNSSFLRVAQELAYTHQEKWDGSGYPQGLKGEEIPLAGRLMAIADVYDALISRRPYKSPLSHEKAVELITQGSGSHFDPELVHAFLEIKERFREIARRFADLDTTG